MFLKSLFKKKPKQIPQEKINAYEERIRIAQNLANDNKVDEAINEYEDAFKILVSPGDVLDLALLYLDNGNSYRSQELIDSIIRESPEDIRGYFYKGIYYETLDDDDSALDMYLKCIDLKKTDNNEAISNIYFKIGRIYDDKSEDKEENEKKKLIEKAKYYYDRAINSWSNNYYAYLNLGSIYEKENNLDKALELSLKANEISHDEKMSSYNLGVIYSKQGKYDKALECYKQEITKEDFYPFAYYNMGLIYKDFYHDYEKAKDCYIEGLKYLKKDASLWYNLGCVHVLLNDYNNAIDCFYCAICLNGDILSYMDEDKEIEVFVKSSAFEILKEKCNK